MLEDENDIADIEDLISSEDVPEPTKAPSACIKPIKKDTVHRICSGQVVLSLAVAVKELVENAIDAGATLVEVKLRDQGLESLEVSDNGSGVEEHNLKGMTAKYHTSKIREFVDLAGVETFGFRGEALSSLCALCEMSIVTRHSSTDVGIRVELDHEGRLSKRTPCARSVGTTVTLVNLFSTLPVRKRDFKRNIRKEFTKMCQMLQAYCLVAKGVRIICTNQTPKGGKSLVMQTHGAADVLANISAIFGSRQTSDLVAVKSPFVDGELSEEGLRAELLAGEGNDSSLQFSGADVELLNSQQFRLDGYVSNCRHGAGRSSKDRQFFYVNSRPCDPKNIAKVINEVYHRYNGQQYPFVYLDVVTARAHVDVNLTPDKRQLLINNEKILLLAIKKALLNTFGNTPATYKLQNASIMSMMHVERNGGKGELAAAVDSQLIVEEMDESMMQVEVPISSSQRFGDVLSQWKHTGDTSGIAPHVTSTFKRKCSEEIAVRTLKMKKIQEYLCKENASMDITLGNYESESDTEDEESGQKEEKGKAAINRSALDLEQLNAESAEYDELLAKRPSDHKASPNASFVERINCKVATPMSKPRLSFVSVQPSVSDTHTPSSSQVSNSSVESVEPAVLFDDSDNDDISPALYCAEIHTSIAEIASALQAEEAHRCAAKASAKLDRLRFKTQIQPSQNKNAETELQREVGKEAFARMQVIGQFNLGFIIVRLDTDLFIVDQHATDEKYNFEMLQRTTRLQNQPLAVPQTLDMTAVNEMVLLDHLPVFEQNGFKFEVNENAPPTRKLRLLGRPFSRNWEFGKEDIDELVFMLHDAPDGTVCRPSRIRAMFASRACRKSVMIGQALSRQTMRQLITHMGEIEQPWNCPHGRPTMRHLVNTAMLLDDDSIDEEKE